MDDTEKEAVRQSLLAWKASGTTNPTIPMFEDVDGDGKMDFYGLDENDQLVTVSGATLESSVFDSTGFDEAEEAPVA